MKGVAIFVLLAGLAGPVLAETITLRLGEHSGFTRVVLDGAATRDWLIGRTETGYALRPAGPPTDAPVGPMLDTSVDFSLDPARRELTDGRISELRSDAATLYLDLACTCRLTSYALSGDRLVLDITDGTPDPNATSEQAFVDAPARTAEAVVTPAQTDAAAPSPLIVTTVTALPDLVSGALGPPNPTTVGETPAEAALQEGADYAAFEDMLIQTLSRAAAEGFVTAPGVATEGEPTTVAGIDAEPGEVSGAQGRTAFDLAKGDLPSAADSDVCAATTALDFLTDDAGFEDLTVGPLLESAWSEDGTVIAESAYKLAQFLMWQGYGAEAAQMFALAGSDSDESRLLRMAALALDGKAAEAPLDGLASCAGIGGLWSLLAGASPALTAKIDMTAAIKTYSAYPAHLRRIIGPLLATHLITHGYIDEARLAANFIPEPDSADGAIDGEHEAETGAEPVSHEPSLTDLTLDAASGADISAELETEIAKAGPDTHEAVLLQSQTRAEEGVEPDAAEIETLQALQADAGNGALAADLFATELRRLLDASRFTDVIERASKAAPDSNSDQVRDLETAAWSALIALGSNFDLALTMRRWPERAAAADLAPGIRERLSERLVEIGTPEAAAPTGTAPAATAESLTVLVSPEAVWSDPKPVAAVKSTLAQLKSEREALEAVLSGD